MTHPRVGVLLPTFDATHSGQAPPVVRGAQLIEELGFHGAWVGDHLACPAPLLDAVSCLAAAAAVTDRIVLGFSVMLVGLRPPAWTAKQLATLDALAPGGRIRLGVGVGGEFPEEFAAAGVPLARRGKRVDETLEVLPDLLTGRPVDFHGSVIEVTAHGPQQPERGLTPAVATLPPVYIGGRGEPALKRAARFADVWMPMWLSPDSIAKRLDPLGELAAAQSRPRPRLASLILVRVDDDAAHGRAEADAHLRGQYGMGLDRVEHWTEIGSAAQIADALSGYVDVGVEEFILMPLGSDPLGQIEGLAEVNRLIAQTPARTATPDTLKDTSCVYS